MVTWENSHVGNPRARDPESVARLYDVACPDCGVNEVLAMPEEARALALRCGDCGQPAPQHFSPAHLPGVRIDAASEDVPIPGRIADGSAGYNAGLPGVNTQIGIRPDGKPRLAYRPITNAELGSNRGVREYAKRHGLEPADGGRYKTIAK